MQKMLTGLQPSGALHIGNYIGALRPFVGMTEEYESILMVADYHALTTVRNADELRNNTSNTVRDYLAVGVDPKKSLIFKQSDVPEHMELAWIFQCLVTVPFLQQAHSYKDKVAKGLEANAGLFAYPMLMAADILLYNTDVVPVGQDQRQHVEYAREAAAKFNAAFGETFKEPKERILENEAIIPGTDGKKMSKSYGNTIPLFGSKEEIRKAVMSIVTDSNAESPEHVYNIHKYFREAISLATLYKENKGSYKTLKDALVEDIDAVIAPMREYRDAISDDEVRAVLQEGGERARAMAGAKMAEIRSKIGISL